MEHKSTSEPIKAERRFIHPKLRKHIKDQSEKRQLSESEIIAECIQYHMENANT